ncbi:hypothetical protein [Aliivibrio salmonicida]|uniref:hypothetical protein n=1 Tax=Aliivibrio salmonicida TaxID=40269 RepID=UPI003D0A79C2
MNKKLYVVSTQVQDTIVVGGIRDGAIFIQTVKQIKSVGSEQFKQIKAEMFAYKQRGFTVVVNEPLQRFAPGFNRCLLSEKDANDEPRLISALTAYQQFSQRKAIVYAKGCRRIDIPTTVYEKVVDDKGQISFRIDWDMIDESVLALLTLIYSAVYHISTEANYLKTVFNELNKKRIKQSFIKTKGNGFL